MHSDEAKVQTGLMEQVVAAGMADLARQMVISSSAVAAVPPISTVCRHFPLEHHSIPMGQSQGQMAGTEVPELRLLPI